MIHPALRLLQPLHLRELNDRHFHDRCLSFRIPFGQRINRARPSAQTNANPEQEHENKQLEPTVR